MRRSEAARYARWSAAVAVSLACITAGVYLRRDWQRISERRKAPPAPPADVEKQSSGLTFSKMDGPRKIFTVEASKSTQFKDQEASLLEDVRVTAFGKTGDRHDVMHTQKCQYERQKGAIVCAGPVQIDLYRACADNGTFLSLVLAFLRVHYVVAVTSLAKSRNSYIFQQAGFLIFELCRLRGFHGEDLARPVHFRKRQAARLFLDICRWRGRRFPAL